MADISRLMNNGDMYYIIKPLHATGVSITGTIVFSDVGNTAQLSAVVYPTGAIEQNVVWSSTNTAVATVNQSGLVTCTGTTGSCSIKITLTVTVNGTSYTLAASKAVTIAKKVQFLLVGGGGAGGRSRIYAGGGGGAGGVIYCSNYLLTGNKSVVVGAGGTSCNEYGTASCGNGKPSCFGTIVAHGGGGGGGGACSYACVGADGGSGGGGAAITGTLGGNGCSGQGHNGGCGYGTYSLCSVGGGGGGYCCVGETKTTLCYGGAGGCGYYSNISGAYYWYASGGTGGGRCCTAGLCGGGYGGACYHNGGGATTYGSGGGGAGLTNGASYCCVGGSGCQGIFILRYPSSCGYNITGGTKYACTTGGVNYCIHCFTSNGTLTVS